MVLTEPEKNLLYYVGLWPGSITEPANATVDNELYRAPFQVWTGSFIFRPKISIPLATYLADHGVEWYDPNSGYD